MKYALIGCGMICANHIRAALETGLEIVALCDLVEENREKALAMLPEEKRSGVKLYADYRAIREKADAEMAQRANLKDAGLLVERTRVERGMFDVVRAFRDAVMAIGQRAAPRCIGLGDARDIEHVITDETRKAFDAANAKAHELNEIAVEGLKWRD